MQDGVATIQGWVDPRFAQVRRAFEENFRERREVGAAFALWHRGRPVAHLWGGLADARTGRAWTPDTVSVLFSATKGLVATAFLMLADRGEVDLDAPVTDVWPTFADPARGPGHARKSRITIRMLLNHRSGLSAIREPLRLRDFADGGAGVRQALERAEPWFEPDRDQAYGPTAWGAFAGQLFLQITGRSVGSFLADQIARPLGVPAFLGAPRPLSSPRATVIPVRVREALANQVPRAISGQAPEGRLFRQVLLGPYSLGGRAFLNPAMPRGFGMVNDPALLALELPWMNGLASAGALARIYAALVSDVQGDRLVSPDAVRALRPRQTWSAEDRVLRKPSGWSQGFVKEEPHLYSPNLASFGHSGAGGVLGWADPDEQLAYAYVMNRMDWRLRSPRALALCHAVYASL